MKFSIIIPVYNVEKYIDKCLKSIYEQTYSNYEVIVVNDGSPDNSQEIIDEYVKKDSRFQTYLKPNGGLSDARNYGIPYATGDYLLFVDSDDYIEKDLLLELSKCIANYDIIKYKINVVDETGNVIETRKELENSREITFKELVEGTDFLEQAWSYAYNLNFWKENKFKFEVGKIHEDFGLTPLCLALAKSIYFLDYYGYNYVQREGSIMNGATKNLKRVKDILYHFDNLTKQIEGKNVNKETKNAFNSYLANSLMSTSKLLQGKDLDEFIKELKNRKIHKYLLDDSLARKIKKLIVKYNMGLYIKRRYLRG